MASTIIARTHRSSCAAIAIAAAILPAACALPGPDVTDPAPVRRAETTTTEASPATGHGLFNVPAPWYKDVSAAPLDPESPQVMSGLTARGGWGTGSLRIDFGIDVLNADDSTPLRAFEPNDDFYDPDCDQSPMPLPAGGHVEGEGDYQCSQDGDCHLIVKQGTHLYEMYRANVIGGQPDGQFLGGCLAVWDLNRDYWNMPADSADYARGDNCTSADAAGYPIADLLFDADEVASGEIAHAIRFILPNNRIRKGEFVRPATHSGAGRGTPTADMVPYGARFRLRPDFDLSQLPSEGARVVARAMQKYGMFLADGGNIALTAKSDASTTAKWDGLLDAHDLAALQPSDFDMVDGGPREPLTFDCARSPM